MSRLRRLGTDDKSLVAFELDGVTYAIDIRGVREIINPLPLVPLVQAPPSVVGVADHRGAVVPVLDLRSRLGLAPVAPTRRTKWIVIARDERLIALIVDAVKDVFGQGAADERQVPLLGASDERRGISAVYAYGGGLVFVLDVDRVASPAEELDVEALKRVVSEAPGGGP